jgi:hypothetical protein
MTTRRVPYNQHDWRTMIYPPSCMDENEVLFLFVIHGGNTSKQTNYFPFETSEFDHIFMYAPPHMTLSNLDLMYTNFTNAYYTLDRTLNADPKENTMYIPPLLYYLGSGATDPIVGLYKLSGNKSGSTVDKILDYKALLGRPEFNNGVSHATTNPVLLSSLTKIVHDYLKTNPLSSSSRKPNFGVFSCQSNIKQYTGTDDPSNEINIFEDNILGTADTDERRNEKEPPQRTFLNATFLRDQSDADHLEHWDFVATIVPLDEKWERNRQISTGALYWEPLAQQKTIGCGLNVLSYLDLVTEEYGRQKLCTLNQYGSSIFKLYDYYYNKFENVIETKDSSGSTRINSQFMIVRQPIDTAMKLLCDTLHTFRGTYGIMFKIYQQNQKKRGHSVILLRHNDGIAFIDPQLKGFVVMDASTKTSMKNSIIETINAHYTGLTEAEICLTIRQKYQNDRDEWISRFDPNRVPRLIEVLDPNKIEIIQRDMNVNTGGMNKKSKKKSKIKTQIKAKKKRNTKKKYQRGGEDADLNKFLALAKEDPSIDTNQPVKVSALSTSFQDE